jgi:apolipoprotein N-acyltransferase
MVNVAFAAIFGSLLSQPSEPKRPNTPLQVRIGVTIRSISKGKRALIGTTILFFLSNSLFGYLTLAEPLIGKRIKIALVQPNIEQVNKWDPNFANKIMQTFSELSEKVSKEEPSIIIWPETATPQSISQSSMVYKAVKNIAQNSGAFLLLGSGDQQKFSGKAPLKEKYFNSAYLVNPDIQVRKNQRYDKIRLFPFSEYLPYKEVIPWSLLRLRQSIEYTPGSEFTLFEIPHGHFGVVICWENVFPDLFREFVKRGAKFMVNITNEAHFGNSSAPYQLLAISVFRAVENGLYVIRCANTGVSAIIDPYGRIQERVMDEKGRDVFVRGVTTGWIIPLETKTLYAQYGDAFVWFAIFVSLGFLIFAAMNRKK